MLGIWQKLVYRDTISAEVYTEFIATVDYYDAHLVDALQIAIDMESNWSGENYDKLEELIIPICVDPAHDGSAHQIVVHDIARETYHIVAGKDDSKVWRAFEIKDKFSALDNIALQDLNEYIEDNVSDPSHILARAYSLQGDLLIEQKKYQEALEAYDQERKLRRKGYDYRMEEYSENYLVMNLQKSAYLAIELGDNDLAERYLDEASLKGQTYATYKTLFKYYKYLGKKDKMVRAARRGLELKALEDARPTLSTKKP